MAYHDWEQVYELGLESVFNGYLRAFCQRDITVLTILYGLYALYRTYLRITFWENERDRVISPINRMPHVILALKLTLVYRMGVFTTPPLLGLFFGPLKRSILPSNDCS